MTFNELYHYGIAGMKWGKRNGPPYPLGFEQKSKAEIRKEYRTDKKEAYNLGRSATIASRTAELAKKKADRAEKNGSQKKKEMTKELEEQTRAEAERKFKLLKEHHSEMLKKYGSEMVGDIRYNKKGELAERVVDGKTIALSVIETFGTAAAAYAFSFPFFIISVPKSVAGLAYDEYNQYKRMYKMNQQGNIRRSY